jgi:hypothetical protein
MCASVKMHRVCFDEYLCGVCANRVRRYGVGTLRTKFIESTAALHDVPQYSYLVFKDGRCGVSRKDGQEIAWTPRQDLR